MKKILEFLGLLRWACFCLLLLAFVAVTGGWGMLILPAWAVLFVCVTLGTEWDSDLSRGRDETAQERLAGRVLVLPVWGMAVYVWVWACW